MADQQEMQRSWLEGGLDRRTFLKGSAGATAALVVHSAFGLDAKAQWDPWEEGRRFFNSTEGQTIEAISERIWPETAESPGAREAGVLFYIDQALAGPYAQYRIAYRDGLRALDQVSQSEYGAAFRNLSEDDQNDLLENIAAGEVVRLPREGLEDIDPAVDEDFQPESVEGVPQIAGLGPAAVTDLGDFFSLVRSHTMEGLFADPIYGGNRDFAGWRAVGYPGPYYVYTAEEQQSFEPLDKPFQSLADF